MKIVELNARLFGNSVVIQIQKDSENISKDVLNIEHIGKEKAMQYAILFKSAPQLLKALKVASQYIEITDGYEEVEIDGEMLPHNEIADIIDNAIKLTE